MSNTRRLLIGFGIIALGVCAALPFRRTPGPQEQSLTVAHQEELELGKDLPLQVPGQKSISHLQSLPLKPSLASESDNGNSRNSSSETETPPLTSHPVDQPPPLPDEYQPLFQPAHASHLAGAVAAMPAADTKPAPLRHHTIHDGDTLESLALRYLGDSARAQEIFAANRNVLSDPEVLPIGVKIVIPPSDTTNQPSGTVTGIRNAPSARIRMQPLAPLPNANSQVSQTSAY